MSSPAADEATRRAGAILTIDLAAIAANWRGLRDAGRATGRPVDCAAVLKADAYGTGDDFTPQNSHVAAALLRRIHEATTAGAPFVDIWGSGTPRREFIHVDDLADACIFAMDRYDGAEPLNLGTGITTSIAELAETIREVVGYKGELRFDRTKPDGMPFKGLDSAPLHKLGWKPSTDLRTGLKNTYEQYLLLFNAEAQGR